ncbi:MAG: zinc-binding dehydrogenase [Candidatus Acidiferrales bacterium]|jgi:NADPH:quinone reductase-like Zn-dependent oxidoreductase
MRAMVVRRYGGPEVLESLQLSDLQPKPGEVLIRVKAIGVNFADLLQRMGVYPGVPKPPFVPGTEIAGVVEKTAEGGRATETPPLRIGEAVAAITGLNAYAEWVAIPAQQAYRLPPGMPFEDAAAMPVNYLTAYHSIVTMGNLQPGDRILIHGAGGGVGMAAVQIARARGLVIFGTAGPAKQDSLRKMGVDHAIDHEKTDFVETVHRFAPDGIEMVMDPIGGRSFSRSRECLGPMGRLVIYGFSAPVGTDGKRNWPKALMALAQTPWFHPLKLMSENIAVMGVSLTGLRSHGVLLQREIEELFRLYTAGKIKPVIGKAFPLAQAAAAHQYIHERKNIGKVILTLK